MVSLAAALAAQHPDLDDPDDAIETGRVLVGGKPMLNPRARVAESAPITVRPELALRGATKLEAAITGFGVAVDGKIALDCGAAAGGFTTVLLDHGAARVYAVDAGFGQLRGELRQSPRVVNLERTNLGDLTRELVPDEIELVTLDLSYLSLARAVPELDRIQLTPAVELVALVKPMFELALGRPPDGEDRAQLDAAVTAARRGVEDAGWDVLAVSESPTRGGRGAVEFLLHARHRASVHTIR
jgi:23S rRNA (cytidine1920-2'-O)/16S rRNA (cytidine1409-2'-O)-methyltransferase